MLNAFLDSKKTFYKISNRDWIKLRDLYRRNWPQHIVSYYTLKTYIEWFAKNPTLDITIYTIDENWMYHGTYVLVEISGPHCNIHFNTLHAFTTSDLMLNALKCLREEANFTLAAFVDQVRPVVDDFLKHLGGDGFQNCSCDTLLYFLPCKEALKLATKPLDGFIFKPLNLEHAELIDSLWPHKYPGSVEFFRNVIRYNLTLGAYEEKDGKLCAWIVQEQIGALGTLQVIDSHKRKGLGEQLSRQMSVLLANTGMDIMAPIVCTNRPSRHLFQKLGFKIIDRVYWYDKKSQEDGPAIDTVAANISQL